MSFVANKIVQYTDADGNPVDVTELAPLPTEDDRVDYLLDALNKLIEEQRITNFLLKGILQ